MKVILLGVLLAIIGGPLGGIANASHSTGRCGGSSGYSALGTIEFGAGHPALTFYLEDRQFFLGGGIWLYQESNGVYTGGASPHENLQRGGTSPTGLYADTCRDVGEWEPDRLIF